METQDKHSQETVRKTLVCGTHQTGHFPVDGHREDREAAKVANENEITVVSIVKDVADGDNTERTSGDPTLCG